MTEALIEAAARIAMEGGVPDTIVIQKHAALKHFRAQLRLAQKRHRRTSVLRQLIAEVEAL